MDEIMYYLIGAFMILSLFVILTVVLIFKRKKTKLIKEIPSEDFKTLNYDAEQIEKRKAISELSNNEKEVNNNAKNNKETSEENQGRLRGGVKGDAGENRPVPNPIKHPKLSGGHANASNGHQRYSTKTNFRPNRRSP